MKEENSGSTFNDAQITLAIYDSNLRYIQVNETLARMHGLPAGAHVGKTIWDTVPHLAPIVAPLLERVLATGEPIMNAKLQVENGAGSGVKHDWLVTMIPLLGIDGRPKAVSVTGVDTTNHPIADESRLSFDSSDEMRANHLDEHPVGDRIQVLKDVALALSTAAEVLQDAQIMSGPARIDLEHGIDFYEEVRRFEVELIQRALKQTGGNQKSAARKLGIKSTTLHAMIKRYDIRTSNSEEMVQHLS